MELFPWLKLWVDMLDEPKLYKREWTDTDRWLWVCLMMVARVHGKTGLIPLDMDGIAWRLRRTVEEIDLSVAKFLQAGLMTMDTDGNLLVTNFEKRQEGKPSDRPEATRERQAKHRAQVPNKVTRDNDNTPNKVTRDRQNGSNHVNNLVDLNVTRDRKADNSRSNGHAEPNKVTRLSRDRLDEMRLDEIRGDKMREDAREIAQPTPTKKITIKACHVPEPFPITEDILKWSTGKGYGLSKEDLEAIAERFVNHHSAKGTLYKVWTKAFYNWVIRDVEDGWGQRRVITGNPGGKSGQGSNAQYTAVIELEEEI